MTPMLGIFASQITGHLQTDNGAYFPIRSYVVPSGGAASVTFSSIPSTYTHLQVRMIARSTRTGINRDYASFYFNSDTGANYRGHNLNGDGSSASAGDDYGFTTEMGVFWLAGNDSGTNVFGAAVMDILDYANTNKYKTTRTLSGIDVNGTNGNITLNSGLWMSTSAISSITIKPTSGTTNWMQYSSFQLYGVKA